MNELTSENLQNVRLQTWRHRHRQRISDIHTQLASVDLSVTGDEDMLYQVIVNLLSNSIKYTPNGGRITIVADTDNLTRSLHFSVSDTGLGIAPDQIDRVFDKFYRVENYRRVAQGHWVGIKSLSTHRGDPPWWSNWFGIEIGNGIKILVLCTHCRSQR